MLTTAQRDEIDARLGTHEAGVEPEPTLRRDLLPVFVSWSQFGEAAEVRSAGMGGAYVEDRRALLHAPRLAWLDEEGHEGTQRTLYLKLWAALDDEAVLIAREALKEAMDRDR